MPNRTRPGLGRNRDPGGSGTTAGTGPALPSGAREEPHPALAETDNGRAGPNPARVRQKPRPPAGARQRRAPGPHSHPGHGRSPTRPWQKRTTDAPNQTRPGFGRNRAPRPEPDNGRHRARTSFRGRGGALRGPGGGSSRYPNQAENTHPNRRDPPGPGRNRGPRPEADSGRHRARTPIRGTGGALPGPGRGGQRTCRAGPGLGCPGPVRVGWGPHGNGVPARRMAGPAEASGPRGNRSVAGQADVPLSGSGGAETARPCEGAPGERPTPPGQRDRRDRPTPGAARG